MTPVFLALSELLTARVEQCDNLIQDIENAAKEASHTSLEPPPPSPLSSSSSSPSASQFPMPHVTRERNLHDLQAPVTRMTADIPPNMMGLQLHDLVLLEFLENNNLGVVCQRNDGEAQKFFEVPISMIIEELHWFEKFRSVQATHLLPACMSMSTSPIYMRTKSLLLEGLRKDFMLTGLPNYVTCPEKFLVRNVDASICMNTPSSDEELLHFILGSIAQLGVLKADVPPGEYRQMARVMLYQAFFIKEGSNYHLDFVIQTDSGFSTLKNLSGSLFGEVKLLVNQAGTVTIKIEDLFKEVLSLTISNNKTKFSKMFKAFHRWGSVVNGYLMGFFFQSFRALTSKPIQPSTIAELMENEEQTWNVPLEKSTTWASLLGGKCDLASERVCTGAQAMELQLNNYISTTRLRNAPKNVKKSAKNSPANTAPKAAVQARELSKRKSPSNAAPLDRSSKRQRNVATRNVKSNRRVVDNSSDSYNDSDSDSDSYSDSD